LHGDPNEHGRLDPVESRSTRQRGRGGGVRAQADEGGRRRLRLVADAFGAVVLPASSAEFADATSDAARDVSITSRGARVHDTPIVFAVPADRMKSVANADSVAIFSPWSHMVRIVPAPLQRPEVATQLFIDAREGVYVPAPAKVEQIVRGDTAVMLNAAFSSLGGAQLDEVQRA
jgi:hypothetical protein